MDDPLKLDSLNADGLKLDHLLRPHRRRELNELSVAVAEASNSNNPRHKANV